MTARLLQWRFLICALLCGLAASLCSAPSSHAQEAQWIWSPLQEANAVPPGNCYFRKTFEAEAVESATVEITCDNAYELYVNGRRVNSGQDWRVLNRYDIQRLLQDGKNVIAVRATNIEKGVAGLVARVTVVQTGRSPVSYSTDESWVSNLKQLRGWEQSGYDDSRWVAARVLGPLGGTEPWLDNVATPSGLRTGRFQINKEFRVERVLSDDEAGSLLAMAFNEFGELFLAQEQGGILLVTDRNRDGIPEHVTTYTEQIKNCHGLLPLNGNLFATGEGPQGPGLYHLVDQDANGTADDVRLLFEFTVKAIEHGPHAIALGPDGYVYVLLGNHAAPVAPPDPESPYHDPYEGDIVPKFEDPGGHANGVTAPGGLILRTDPEGSRLEWYAGGLRNPYDIAFNEAGDLFTFDADMEWDVGTPWYRPTRINHVIAGGEFGWRAGWSKWPEYYADSLPATLNVGRGSPTGVEVYHHTKFPARYHGALFVGDWSQGQILSVRLERSNGTYTAKSEVFCQGSPLNITDLAVGPDGWLYFCNGGRDSQGGVYRVVWTGRVPPPPEATGLRLALQQPQLHSAWARQEIAELQIRMGDAWDRDLLRVVQDKKAPIAERTRALDLMQLFGPAPSTDLLAELATDGAAEVRCKAAWLMGLYPAEACIAPLTDLLDDRDASVRRIACEAIVRGGYAVPVVGVYRRLSDSSRYVAFAARRMLERVPVEQWREEVLTTQSPRVYLLGSIALLTATPNHDDALDIVARGEEFLQNYLTDDDFIDLLRVLELAIHRGQLQADELPELATQVSTEYPANDYRMNRELLRLIAFLQPADVVPRILEQLASDIPPEEKLQAALYAKFLEESWTHDDKFALIDFYEGVRDAESMGESYGGYIDLASRDFFLRLDEVERREILAQAARWPTSAVSVLATLPPELSPEMIQQILDLDDQVRGVSGAGADMLRTAIVAVLARSGSAEGMAHLRELFEQEPERRLHLAMGLAQQPDGDNWPLLVRALPILEGGGAQEVIARLASVDRQPEDHESIRQAILAALKMGPDNGGTIALRLLENWTGESPIPRGAPWEESIAAWQSWYRESYPQGGEPSLPVAAAESKWDYEQLLTHLTGPEGRRGNADSGSLVFEQGQCLKCHRYGPRGESIGPDLTTVSRRFQTKEVLQSILYPSHTISDQYASRTVLTSDGLQYTGIVAERGQGTLVILQTDGQKVTVKQSNVEEVVPSRLSAMPEGLLNRLTLQQITDLFAYLMQPAPAQTARSSDDESTE